MATEKDLPSRLRRLGTLFILLGTTNATAFMLSVIDKAYDKHYLYLGAISFVVSMLLYAVANFLKSK